MNLKNFGGAAIERECYEKIREILPRGKTILELGSGTGTKELVKHYTTISVEHDEKYLNQTGSHYIHAPLDDNLWYNRQILAMELPYYEYDMILVDGPPSFLKSGFVEDIRLGFVKNIGLFNTKVPIVFDDVERRAEYAAMVLTSFFIGRKYEVFKGKKKQFGIL